MTSSDLDHVVPLSKLHDLEVADGEPDVRGWSVVSADGRKIGEVDQLLVDTDAMKVRYLDVEMSDGSAGAEGRHTLLPIGYAALDRHTQTVRATTLHAADCAGVPPYGREPLTRQGAMELDDHWRARGGAGEEQRLTLSEEQLMVRKRERPAGEVAVDKHVVSEHVSRAVPLTHDEVTVERRPADPLMATRRIGEESIRVPLAAEEAVVEKRVVPKEELVVRTRQVTGKETVEADLRRERAEVTRNGGAVPANPLR